TCLDGILTSPTCQPSSFTVAPPAHGTPGSFSNVLGHATSCQITCAAGYNVTGDATTCSYGELVNQTCTESPCIFDLAPAEWLNTCPSNAGSLTQANLASGASCQLACSAGYTLTTSPASASSVGVSCHLGVLTSTQDCTPSPCAVVAPINGSLGDCPTKLLF